VGHISTTPLPQPNARAMIRQRAAAAGIKTLVGNHIFAPQVSLLISTTEVYSRTPLPWQTMPRREQPNFMIAEGMNLRSMRWSGSSCNRVT
jgi:hypothetical protein